MREIEPGWQFASDNTAGICPEAWAALTAANDGYAPSYGTDAWTQRASELVRALFENEAAQVYFVFNGTAAKDVYKRQASFSNRACTNSQARCVHASVP